MLHLPGQQIGDAWYFAADDAIHAFFLTMPVARRVGWDIGHAASRDLIHWDYLGLALTRGPAGAWDERNLATGGVIKREGRYWMAYTGHKEEDSFVQRVGMAVSDDLVDWEKLAENPTSEANPDHYEIVSTGQRTLTHWRDPFLLDTSDIVYQYVCARRRDGDETERGSIGVARSTDMVHWETLPPVEHDRMTEEMEVPQVYPIDGRYYLVFCTHDFWLAPSFKNRFPGYPFRSTDYAMVGDSPLGPFHIHDTGEIMPEAPPRPLYASQLVSLQDEWFLLGTTREADNTTRISDPWRVVADVRGIHVVD